MNTKTLLLTFVLLLTISFAQALEPQDFQWNGSANVYLANDSFSSDENISGYIVLSNIENYSMVGNKLVFQIAQGEYSYPSEFANDNVILESSISDVWVLPRGMKKVEFSLPPQAPGRYRLDCYSWILKSKFIGSSSIFLSPSSIDFTVLGTPSQEKVIIDRKNTVFGTESKKVSGPNGFPINAGDSIKGIVFVKNNSQTSISGLKLELSLCDWASVFCSNPNKQFFEVPTLAANETKEITVTLTAPNIPSAYEINIRLAKGEQTLSIYKNRVIVSGGTAKLRKIFIEGLKDKNYTLTAIISGSPDHFSNPVFENFQIIKQLFDKESIVSEESISVAKLDYYDINAFTFQAKVPSFDKACVRIAKENVTYEEECFSVPLEEIQKSYDELNPKAVEVSWNYNELSSNLTLYFKKDSLNTRYRLIDSDKTILEENVIQKGNFQKDISIEKKDLTLIVDDFDAKLQQVFTINLFSTSDKIKSTQNANDSNNPGQDILCKETLCKDNETCTGPAYLSANGTCCTKTCINSVITQNNFELPPLILLVAIILVIIAILVGFSAVKGMKK